MLCRYGELEEVVLGESLAAVRLPDLEDDLDSSASSLSSFAATTESALSAALERCRQATGPSLTVNIHTAQHAVSAADA